MEYQVRFVSFILVLFSANQADFFADEQTIEAMKFGASTEAFITDPVYEGKSLAGMMDMIKKGEIAEGSNVLYAHLGGQLALNAYSTIP